MMNLIDVLKKERKKDGEREEKLEMINGKTIVLTPVNPFLSNLTAN